MTMPHAHTRPHDDDDDEDSTCAVHALRAQLRRAHAVVAAMQRDCDAHARRAEQLLQHIYGWSDRVKALVPVHATTAAATTASTVVRARDAVALYVASARDADLFVPASWPDDWHDVLHERVCGAVWQLQPGNIDDYWQAQMNDVQQQQQQQQQEQQTCRDDDDVTANVATTTTTTMTTVVELLTQCAAELLSLLSALLTAMHTVAHVQPPHNNNSDDDDDDNDSRSMRQGHVSRAHALWQVYWLRHLYNLLCATLRGVHAVLSADEALDHACTHAVWQRGDATHTTSSVPAAPAMRCVRAAMSRTHFSCTQCGTTLRELLHAPLIVSPLIVSPPSREQKSRRLLLLHALTYRDCDGRTLDVSRSKAARAPYAPRTMPPAARERDVREVVAYLASLLA